MTRKHTPNFIMEMFGTLFCCMECEIDGKAGGLLLVVALIRY